MRRPHARQFGRREDKKAERDTFQGSGATELCFATDMTAYCMAPLLMARTGSRLSSGKRTINTQQLCSWVTLAEKTDPHPKKPNMCLATGPSQIRSACPTVQVRFMQGLVQCNFGALN